eukprot:ctg_556.g280
MGSVVAVVVVVVVAVAGGRDDAAWCPFVKQHASLANARDTFRNSPAGKRWRLCRHSPPAPTRDRQRPRVDSAVLPPASTMTWWLPQAFHDHTLALRSIASVRQPPALGAAGRWGTAVGTACRNEVGPPFPPVSSSGAERMGRLASTVPSLLVSTPPHRSLHRAEPPTRPACLSVVGDVPGARGHPLRAVPQRRLWTAAGAANRWKKVDASDRVDESARAIGAGGGAAPHPARRVDRQHRAPRHGRSRLLSSAGRAAGCRRGGHQAGVSQVGVADAPGQEPGRSAGGAKVQGAQHGVRGAERQRATSGV